MYLSAVKVQTLANSLTADSDGKVRFRTGTSTVVALSCSVLLFGEVYSSNQRQTHCQWTHQVVPWMYKENLIQCWRQVREFLSADWSQNGWISKIIQNSRLSVQHSTNLNGNKMINRAALLDIPNVFGPDGSNSESETSNFAGIMTLKKMYPLFYSRLFRNVSRWEKVFFGPRGITWHCNTTFGHYKILPQISVHILGAWSTLDIQLD